MPSQVFEVANAIIKATEMETKVQAHTPCNLNKPAILEEMSPMAIRAGRKVQSLQTAQP